MKKITAILSLSSIFGSFLCAEEIVQEPSPPVLPESSEVASLESIKTSNLPAEESLHKPIQSTLSERASPTPPPVNLSKESKTFGFVSAPIPGVGASVRVNNFSFDVSIQSVLLINAFSVSASPTFYFSKGQTRPYASLGIGAAIVNLPIYDRGGGGGLAFPLRLGVEGQRFFGDIGGTAILLSYEGFGSHNWYKEIVPIPEIRVGIGF